MTKQERTHYRVLGLVSLSLIIATATYSFAEANTTIHSSGVFSIGYGVKSSYDISRISYTLDVENPNTFTSLDFEINQEGVEVFAGVSATEKGQITWAENCMKSNTKWTCTFDESIDVLAADWLHVSSIQ